MNTRTSDSLATQHVRGHLAAVLFAFTIIAFAVESQLTQYVQTTLGYRQPFFIFYLVHSLFTIIFPLHVLYLLMTTDYTAAALLKGLNIAITDHPSLGHKSTRSEFPRAKFLRLVLGLTFGITCPGLLWFSAVSLTSITDVTAIGNTNAFFAYIISVKLFKSEWEFRRLLAVVIATVGTFAVIYGGTTSGEPPSTDDGLTTTNIFLKPTAPLLGNLLTLLAAFGSGLYQVLYKIYAALPSDPEVASDPMYEQIPGDDEDETPAGATHIDPAEVVYPPPFGFHPNLLTSLMGFMTLITLWIPIPLLHWSGAEVFRVPPNALTVLSIAGIALSGVVYNAGLMVLLGVWGPIIVSVGNLLTIILILISDIIFGAGIEVLTFWSVTGSATIVLAFGVLAYDMFRKQ